MKITIIETNEKTELSIIDPKSGCDWTNDLLGNHNELPDYDDDDTYHMSQKSYDWWADLIENYQAADNRCHALLQELSGKTYDDMENEIHNINCDLEDLPAYINDICDNYKI